MKKNVMFLSIVFALMSCSSSKQATMTGNDRDKHGCIPSAGYTWSEVRKDCIKVFEVGTRLNNVIDTKATTSAFAVFSSDKSVVELFLPDSSDHSRLKKSVDGWKNKRFKLKKSDNKLSLYKGGKLIYQE